MRPALTILSLLAIVAADAASAQTRARREGASPQRPRLLLEGAPARAAPRGVAARPQSPPGTIGPNTPNADGNFGGPGGGGGGGGP